MHTAPIGFKFQSVTTVSTAKLARKNRRIQNHVKILGQLKTIKDHVDSRFYPGKRPLTVNSVHEHAEPHVPLNNASPLDVCQCEFEDDPAIYSPAPCLQIPDTYTQENNFALLFSADITGRLLLVRLLFWSVFRKRLVESLLFVSFCLLKTLKKRSSTRAAPGTNTDKDASISFPIQI
ncbi:hypothetical protein VTO42DRAFT_3076 [Malbranchea cinnamomea]